MASRDVPNATQEAMRQKLNEIESQFSRKFSGEKNEDADSEKKEENKNEEMPN